jgi:hypothetical protein
MKKICKWESPSPGPPSRHPAIAANSKIDPDVFVGKDGERAPRPTAGQNGRHDLARIPLHQPPQWGAGPSIDGQTCISPTCGLDALDRVGDGDGFAAGRI